MPKKFLSPADWIAPCASGCNTIVGWYAANDFFIIEDLLDSFGGDPRRVWDALRPERLAVEMAAGTTGIPAGVCAAFSASGMHSDKAFPLAVLDKALSGIIYALTG